MVNTNCWRAVLLRSKKPAGLVHRCGYVTTPKPDHVTLQTRHLKSGEISQAYKVGALSLTPELLSKLYILHKFKFVCG